MNYYAKNRLKLFAIITKKACAAVVQFGTLSGSDLCFLYDGWTDDVKANLTRQSKTNRQIVSQDAIMCSSASAQRSR